MLIELTPVIRYWEFTAKELQVRLEKLRDQDCRVIAAWVPWSHLETDRHHLLQKMVRQAFRLGIKVKLGVTPELGIGYWNNGLPEDLLKERTQLAQDRTGQPLYNCAPPNIHPLPSLSSPTVFQRYGHFLLKLSQELGEVLYENPEHTLELSVTDSLFKHYRTKGSGSEDHGDFSIRYLHQGSGGLAQDASPSGAESMFLNRTKDFLRARFDKYKNVKIAERKVFSRSASLDRLMEELARSGANLPELFRELYAARAHSNLVWLDDLFGLSDRERNFLISAALVTFQQVWISEDVFQQCSVAFRRRIENLISGFSSEEAAQIQSATIFVANRFAPARLAQNLRQTLGARLNFEALQFGPLPENFLNKRLIVVEEGLTLEFQQYREFLNLSQKAPCTVVLFKSSLCERALREIAGFQKFQIQRGWNYDVVMQASGGQILMVEGKESSLSSMPELAESIIAVAQLQSWCHLNKPLNQNEQEVFSVSIDWSEKTNETVKTIFLLNPLPTATPLSLSFAPETKVQGIFFGGEQRALEPLRGEVFEGVLPAFSVVPLTAYLQKQETHANKIEPEETLENARSTPELA